MSFSSEDIKKLRQKTGAGMMDCKKALDETGDIEKAVDWLRKKGINTAQKKSSRTATDGLITIKIDKKKGIILEVNSETDFVAKNDNFQSFCEMISSLCINNDIDSVDTLLDSKSSNGNFIKDELTNLISKLGENIIIKRLSFIKNDAWKFQKYLHNSVSEDSGKLGVLLCFNSKAQENEEENNLSKQICMHIAASDPKSLDIKSLDESLISNEKEIYRAQLKSSGKPDEIIDKIIDGKIKKYFEEVCLLEQYFVIDNKIKIKDLISDFNKNHDSDFLIEDYYIFKLGT